MSERSRIFNGRFENDLDNWTASGSAAYSAGDGDEHYGVAQLAVGDSIDQDFTVPLARVYTLHLALKCAQEVTAGQVTAVITDGAGSTVTTKNPLGDAGEWTETEYSIGLVPGTTYNLAITNVSAGADVLVDDVWLWFVPLTRAQMAARVHAKLGRLASQRSLSTAANGALTEGDFTYAVDAGLRSTGAINPETGEVDVRYLDESNLHIALDLIEREMLERLQRDYAVEVDVQAGPVREQRSQVNRALESLTGTSRESNQGGGGQGAVVMRKLSHEREDSL